jgi:Holliday junction DNA helicase RuvA
MIGRITGQLAEKNPPELLVDCHGVGYELLVPMSTFYNLPGLGETVSLLTHFVVREDAQILFGFATASERSAFRQLIKISGVGPRTALSVLSGMSVDELSRAVSAQEAGRIIKVPGIGKKTAERLLLELKDKLPKAGLAAAGATLTATPDAGSDILNALLALGYSEKEAGLALKALPAGVGVSEGIKLALKSLNR